MKTSIAGGSFLSNLQNKRFELEEGTTLEENPITEIDEVNIEVSEKDIVKEIDIQNYLNKPIELLIEESTKAEVDKEFTSEMKFYLEERTKSVIDIDFIDILEEEETFENINSEIGRLQVQKETQDEMDYFLVKSLQDKINDIEEKLYAKDLDIQKKLYAKDKEIQELKEENKGLKKTLLKEQDIVMKEQDLHDKTLSRVEQLLVEKRNELIERQKASRKNWFLKFIDKIKS